MRVAAALLGLYAVPALVMAVVWGVSIVLFAVTSMGDGLDGGLGMVLAMVYFCAMVPIGGGLALVGQGLWYGAAWARAAAIVCSGLLVVVGAWIALEVLGMHGAQVELAGTLFAAPAAVALVLLALPRRTS